MLFSLERNSFRSEAGLSMCAEESGWAVVAFACKSWRKSKGPVHVRREHSTALLLSSSPHLTTVGTKDLIKADFNLSDTESAYSIFVRRLLILLLVLSSYSPPLRRAPPLLSFLTAVHQVFILVYMFATPVFGILADRGVNRRVLLIVQPSQRPTANNLPLTLVTVS